MMRKITPSLAALSLVALPLLSMAEDAPYSLAGLVGLPDDSPWKIGGWTQIGYYNNNIPLSFSEGDLLSFHDNSDKVQLNQQWLFLERSAATEEGFGFGGRIDVMYGADAQKTQSFGNPGAGIRNEGNFDASWDNGKYGFAIPQLYAEVAYSDVSVKLGHFFTPIGYEVVPATGNFFYSHSYTMFNSEPFTHTGALAAYTGFKGLTIYGGWAAGWDTGFDRLNSGSTWLGGVSADLTDKINLAYMGAYGNFGWRDGGGDGSYSHSVVLTANITDKLQYVAQNDIVRITDAPFSDFKTTGLNQYLFYSINEQIRIGTRYELWKADGTKFSEATAGVHYLPHGNVTLRAEYRHDRSSEIGLKENAVSVDLILRY